MDRPKPTKQMLIELCGNNQCLISSVYKGLYECPLSDFYPNLNLDETIAFAASSWKAREKDLTSFSNLLESADIYNVFNKVFKIGIPWLAKYKQVSDNLRLKHQKLNPFKEHDLKERLDRVDRAAVQRLRERLQKPVNEYVFECNYNDVKEDNGGDNHKIKPMCFQSVYPRKGKIIPAFASEIAKIISNYPKHCAPRREIVKPASLQLSLF